MSEFETLLYEIEHPIAWVTLNRPQVLNALNDQMEDELRQAIARAEADAEVRVIVLRAAGRAFSAGYDLKETAATPVRGVAAWRRRLENHLRLTRAVWECPKPLVSAVQGYCLGGGCDLALICDLSVAAESACFGEPEVRFGSGVVTLIMPWVLGMKKTREMLYTGDRITAQEALALGMVNRVMPDDELLETARALAIRMATVDADSLRLTKAALNRTYELMGLKSALAYNIEVTSQIEAMESTERREFDRLRGTEGLQKALEWRDGRFGERGGGG